MSRISLFPRQSRLSRAVRGALAILALGTAVSAGAADTGELAASAAGGPAPLNVTVQPGQSLNDLAKAATQSHDPAVLARAGRALFDANPQAFMKRDPSRLKVGATLTVPALDATGATLVAAGASSASGAAAVSAPASAVVAASGTAAVAQHGASAPHPGSAVQGAPAASAAHAAPVSGASVAVAAGASAPIGASAAHGASTAEPVQPAAPAAGASGPHVWSGAIQSAPSSASDAAAQVTPGGAAQGMHEPSAAAPVAGASQPRPSSLQQLLALKNRVLMELQKHGIGKPADTNNVAPARAPAPAPAAPRPAANDAGASAAASASAASEAAAGVVASAVQPASAPVQPAVPVTTAAPARGAAQIDWRPTAMAGAAVLVLAAWFAWRKRRKARPADAITSESGGAAAVDAGASSSPVEPLPSILPETLLARDAAADVNLIAATAAAAGAVDTHEAEVASPPETATPHDDQPEAPSAHVALERGAAPASHDVKPVAETAADEPLQTPAAPSTNDAQHAALMQNAISALNSLDMPLPPRQADEPAAREGQAESDQIATNGQFASRPPIGAGDLSPEHPADQDDEFGWDPDAATPAPHAGGASAPSSLPPLGGAQFGALKLDFDLDLPSAPGAALPALTPEELARIARNKLDLASEYVELGDLSGARMLLQEVIDANDAATRDDARALLAKLADEA
ncbi:MULTISPECIES: FimV/HubP family polar landmark protein [unclassified Burkholderia]|uniref:FimV/HubP family polar landmark protein n=1 Tax=unclassified Burkholderia TaxID=2613784 RepID=UPI001E4806FB|nr:MULTISPECIES: FimV/HubP family polar landmark protein [unclassified Burkholderia]UEP29674.1 pilus assembly protein FimV [Burkholderia sp. B21-007]UEP45011.1 pilus assembly protein FimV [Burkholderia sp. B21-005]